MVRRSFWAFFNLRPALPLPAPDLLLVPLQGAPRRTLTAPSQLPQDAPRMSGMVLNAACLLDEMGHARRGPQAGLVAQRLRAALQSRDDALAVVLAQARLAPGADGLLQPGAPFLFQFGGPLPHRLPVRAHPPRHFRLAVPLLQQTRRPHPPPLQCLEVSAYSGRESQAHTVA